LPKKPKSASDAQPVAEQAAVQSTKDKIIDAAEMLFAQQGYEGTTTRAIALKANVPLGLMSYYFGTKGDLYSEVIMRRSSEHAADIAASLQAAKQRAGDGPVAISDLVTAFVMPIVRRSLESGPGWRAYVKLLSLAANTPGAEPHTKTFAREYAAVVADFIAMMKQKLPDASDENIYWAYYILNSAIIHIIVENRSIDRLSGGRCKASDLRTVAEKLAIVFEAGIERLARG
jgi:AcrR family transcriptional regulator